MKFHEIKVTPDHWDKYKHEICFSVRNDDRGFEEGDICIFRLWSAPKGYMNDSKEYMNDSYSIKRILAIHRGMGMKCDYCILTLKAIADERGLPF